MKVLITGSDGQLGKELKYTCPSKINLINLNKASLDISNHYYTYNYIKKNKPDVILNTAAYTNVEKAEIEKDSVLKINELAVSNLAKICNKQNIRLIHFSTDFVFDGMNKTPYTEDSRTNPLNMYGKSKYAGELSALKENKNTLIIRTSWLYSKHGNNFVKTMLNVLENKPVVKVVNDQFGSPTWARSLAQVTWQLIEYKDTNGVFHFSNQGVTNWHEFACTINKLASQLSIINSRVKILGINSNDYQTNVNRPAFSVLDNTKLNNFLKQENEDWKICLFKMLKDYKADINS